MLLAVKDFTDLSTELSSSLLWPWNPLKWYHICCFSKCKVTAVHFGIKRIRKMRLWPIHHLPPTARGSMKRWQEIDQTGLSSIPLFSTPKMRLWSDWYWITDHAATAESLFDLRDSRLYSSEAVLDHIITSFYNVLTLMLPKSRTCSKAVRGLFFTHNLTCLFSASVACQKLQLCVAQYIPFGGEKSMDGVKPTVEMIVSSMKNSKIVAILKEATVRPLLKDHHLIIIFWHKQVLCRTAFASKPTQRESRWL